MKTNAEIARETEPKIEWVIRNHEPCADIHAEVRNLILAAITEAQEQEKKETERLDWLERHARWSDYQRRMFVDFKIETLPFVKVREAIDAAMQKGLGDETRTPSTDVAYASVAFGDFGMGHNGEPKCSCGGTCIKLPIIDEDKAQYWECEDCGTVWP